MVPAGTALPRATWPVLFMRRKVGKVPNYLVAGKVCACTRSFRIMLMLLVLPVLLPSTISDALMCAGILRLHGTNPYMS